MRSLLVLMLAAAFGAPVNTAPSAPAAARVSVAVNIVEAIAHPEPRSYSATCGPGKRLLAGGYSVTGTDLRIVSSYPASDTSWTVSAWNPTKLPIPLRIEVTCLADGSPTVQSKTRPGVDCPQGTVATGGGYLSKWTPAEPATAVLGNRAAPGGWAVDLAPTRIDVHVFALCLGGPAVSGTPVQLDLPASAPECTETQVLAAKCTWLRTGRIAVSCAAGGTFAGLGYETTAGSLPAFAVLGTAAGELRVHTRTVDNNPLSIRVTPICLSWPAPAAGGADWRYLAVGGVVVLLGVFAAYRWRSRRLAGSAGLEVVVTGQSSTFRLDRFRETP